MALSFRRCSFLPLLLGASLGVLPLVHAQAPQASAAWDAAALLRGGAGAFSGSPGRWAWLRGSGSECELFTGGPGRSPKAVARGAGWTEVALLGDDVWVMHRDRDSGELLKVRPDRQSVLEAVARSLPRPGGLYAHQDRLYWIESHAAAPENAVFVPPVGPLAVLRCREASGAVREVGVWPGGVEGADGAPAGQIVGVDGEALIVCVYRLSSTEIVSFPPSGQAPVRLAGAAGRQAAVLHGGSLYWTAPSLEAASAGRRCVRCLPLPPAGSEPRTLTDWLPGEGRLISLDTDLYYAADVLYRLSQAPGAAGALRGIPSGSVVTDGASLIHLDAAGVPNVIPAR